MECVKCGEQNAAGVAACGRCTWPFSLAAWASTSFWIRRVTLDARCIDSRGQTPELSTLESWESEGKVELHRSDTTSDLPRHGAPGIRFHPPADAQPGLFTQDSRTAAGPGLLTGPDLGSELEAILFPDSHPLTDGQARDLEHLRRHVLVGGDVFVTLNVNDFVLRGRSEALRARGIWVLTPAELVTLLNDLYEWT